MKKAVIAVFLVIFGACGHSAVFSSERAFADECSDRGRILTLKPATKEIGERTRLSFYVNNIIDINPIYKRADHTTGRDWAVSFFGVELMMRL